MPEPTAVILCRCGDETLPDPSAVEAARRFLAEQGITPYLVQDLCRTAVAQPQTLAYLNACETVYVFACGGRAVTGLLARAGVDLAGKTIRTVNLRQPPGEAFEAVKADLAGQPTIARPENAEPPAAATDWVPWFPVIDPDHCMQCRQCLNFCLFGVYAINDANRVTVVRPAACKTNCPACARVCTANAIVFPRHTDPTINGEQPPRPAAHGDENADLLDRLRRRNAQTPDATAPDLRSIQAHYAIPDEVLNGLSPADLNALQQRHDKGTP